MTIAACIEIEMKSMVKRYITSTGNAIDRLLKRMTLGTRIQTERTFTIVTGTA